jgi:hypothetical protein
VTIGDEDRARVLDRAFDAGGVGRRAPGRRRDSLPWAASPRDVDEDSLDAFDYSLGGAAWIELNRERFDVIKPSLPELPET